jgi:hypothetical protein
MAHRQWKIGYRRSKERIAAICQGSVEHSRRLKMKMLRSFEMPGNEKPREAVSYHRRMDSQLLLFAKLIRVLLSILEKYVVRHDGKLEMP